MTLIILAVFIVQFFYFKSRYNLQKYFLLKNNKKLKKGYSYFVEAMIALANKDKKNAVIANNMEIEQSFVEQGLNDSGTDDDPYIETNPDNIIEFLK